jgi:hypothetical protein
VQERVEVWELEPVSVTVFGASWQSRPVLGVVEFDRTTVPVNPPTGDTVIVLEAEELEPEPAGLRVRK